MTAFSELKQRARAEAHDIVGPAETDPATGTLTGKDVAERAVGRRTIVVQLAGDAAAGTQRAHMACVGVPASEFPDGAKVVSINLRTAAVSNEATDYFTDTFSQLSALGVTGNQVAILTSNSATAVAAGGMTGAVSSSTAGRPYSAFLTATLADRVLAAGGGLLIARTKATAGKQIADATYTIVLEAL